MKSLVLIALALIALSGLPDIFIGRRSNVGHYIAHAIHTVVSLFLVFTALSILLTDKGIRGQIGILGDGFDIHLAFDPLAAVFVLPIAVITNLSSLYGLRYWTNSAGSPRASFLRLMFGTVSAGLFMVVLAGDIISFLFGWEIMALSAFFLVITDERSPGVREAGWLYFVTTHVSTLVLFAFFALMWSVTGSNTFAALAQIQLEPQMAAALFLLALIAFGIKAGIFPGHFWLPPAHASAPSHVSALMSGVLIKVGIYGLIRTLFLLQTSIQLWWGIVVISLGTISAVLGVAFALGQHDLKRLLACHSIENIGIICIGLGIMLLGVSQHSSAMIALGLTGALLHVWNHALFKALLFLSAGSVIHAVKTREIDLMGGLIKSMPRTAFFFFFGACAICGLPPLNGFISEFLIYCGLIQGLSGHAAYALVAACLGLALVGGLAVGCFVKVFGAVFLGSGRSHHVDAGHEAPVLMQAGMVGMVIGCSLIGLLPTLAASLLRAPLAQWFSSLPKLEALQNGEGLSALALINPLLAFALIVVCLSYHRYLRKAKPPQVVTWDCGYAKPAQTMQYTASSFAQMFVDLLANVLTPITKKPVVEGIFPARASFHSFVPDIVLDRTVKPIFGFADRCFAKVRLMQRGNLQAYISYILLTFILFMIFAVRG